MRGLIQKPRFFSFGFKPKKDTLPKSLAPKIRTKTLPGPKSLKLIESLKRFECPQVTFINEYFPVFFHSGRACNLTDVDGNRFLDLTSCFGVSSLGHSHPVILESIKKQSRRMVHGMGDVHPNEVKVELAQKLSEITPGNLNQSIFSCTGSEAVESALKTAVMHTKKTGVIAFTGAYHGLGYGALSLTHRADFKKPFLKQLGAFSYTAPFPDARIYESKASQVSLKAVQSLIKKARRSRHPVGAVIIEPVQGRGGVVPAPPEFLRALRALCDEEKILLIADEVFTGFGRTGAMFAIEKSGIVPDLLCLGKGLGGGFPISVCIGTTRVMHSWGQSSGDAIHTSTFLGHPLACAVALSVIEEIRRNKLVEHSKAMGDNFRKALWKLKEKYPLIGDVRGAGLMIGIEFSETSGKKRLPATDKTRRFIVDALRQGLVILSSGSDHNVVSVTPPLVISDKEVTLAIQTFDKLFQKLVY